MAGDAAVSFATKTSTNGGLHCTTSWLWAGSHSKSVAVHWVRALRFALKGAHWQGTVYCSMELSTWRQECSHAQGHGAVCSAGVPAVAKCRQRTMQLKLVRAGSIRHNELFQLKVGKCISKVLLG